MKRYNSKVKNFANLLYNWLIPQGDVINFPKSGIRYIRFFNDMKKYSSMPNAEKIKLVNTYPCLHDKTESHTIDSHYFYQNIWCFKKIFDSKVQSHIDVGSKHDFVGFLTSITKVTFVDIRPLNVNLKNLNSKKGNILSLPFDNDSVLSLSCLHVAEHIGLGRYGDTLDTLGTKKAAEELTRVLAFNGNLYFSLPVGKPRLCFNAHRIHSPDQILKYFNDLKLVEFSGIDDDGNFRENIDTIELKNCDYGCGLFWFTKNK